MIKEDPRPAGCRFRLRDEGKPYPRSSCTDCGAELVFPETCSLFSKNRSQPRLLIPAGSINRLATNVMSRFTISINQKDEHGHNVVHMVDPNQQREAVLGWLRDNFKEDHGVGDNSDKALPKFKSHKVVEAARILDGTIRYTGDGVCHLVLEGVGPLVTGPGWAQRYKGDTSDRGYFVRYDDGYESWSPSKAFEEGYTAIDDGSERMPYPSVDRPED